MMTALLQETATRNELGDQAAAGRALERALDIAESTGMRLPFLLGPVPAQLDPHRTAHSALVSQIQELLAARGERLPTTGKERPAGIAPPRLIEPLTDSETRVLHYLPTHLTAQEIASEMSVSVTTVRTHIHHLFLKLGVHRRHHAIERACDLGLLAPSLRSAPNEHVKQPAVWHLPALKKLF
jgi:LuxR family maltose regulon positive regulatory protein